MTAGSKPAAIVMDGQSRARSIYTVALFCLLYMVMYLDRNIVNLLLEPMKKELQLSDLSVALIAGFGFSLFQTLFGLPVARWADRGDRRVIITLTTALWATMTILCGFAQSAWQVALARCGVGIGESTSPVLHSILSDQSNKNTRAAVMSFLTMGGPLAALLCYPLVGLVEQAYGWRAAFIAAGVPGLLVCALVWFTYRDRLREADKRSATPTKAPPLREVLAYFGRTRSYVYSSVGYVVAQFGIIGFNGWAPALLRRVHHFGAAQVGASFGLSTGLLGIAGALAGALVLGLSARHGDRWKLLWPAIATLLAAPLMLVATNMEAPPAVLGALGMVAFMAAFKFGPTLAVNQSVVKPRMRALGASLMGFVAALLAIGLGPVAVGAVSDLLTPRFGEDGLRYAMMMCPVFVLIGGGLLLYGARFIEADIATAEAGETVSPATA